MPFKTIFVRMTKLEITIQLITLFKILLYRKILGNLYITQNINYI